MTDLRSLLSPDLLDALDALIRERVAEALAAQHPNGDRSPWLTIGEAAAYVSASPRTIARRIKTGDLRSTVVGRRRIVHRADLDAMLDAGRK